MATEDRYILNISKNSPILVFHPDKNQWIAGRFNRMYDNGKVSVTLENNVNIEIPLNFVKTIKGENVVVTQDLAQNQEEQNHNGDDSIEELSKLLKTSINFDKPNIPVGNSKKAEKPIITGNVIPIVPHMQQPNTLVRINGPIQQFGNITAYMWPNWVPLSVGEKILSNDTERTCTIDKINPNYSSVAVKIIHSRDPSEIGKESEVLIGKYFQRVEPPKYPYLTRERTHAVLMRAHGNHLHPVVRENIFYTKDQVDFISHYLKILTVVSGGFDVACTSQNLHTMAAMMQGNDCGSNNVMYQNIIKGAKAKGVCIPQQDIRNGLLWKTRGTLGPQGRELRMQLRKFLQEEENRAKEAGKIDQDGKKIMYMPFLTDASNVDIQPLVLERSHRDWFFDWQDIFDRPMGIFYLGSDTHLPWKPANLLELAMLAAAAQERWEMIIIACRPNINRRALLLLCSKGLVDPNAMKPDFLGGRKYSRKKRKKYRKKTRIKRRKKRKYRKRKRKSSIKKGR